MLQYKHQFINPSPAELEDLLLFLPDVVQGQCVHTVHRTHTYGHTRRVENYSPLKHAMREPTTKAIMSRCCRSIEERIFCLAKLNLSHVTSSAYCAAEAELGGESDRAPNSVAFFLSHVRKF